VRNALGLTRDDPLPEVDEDILLAYHRYLTTHLIFPVEAKWEPESRPTIKIAGLIAPEADSWVDEMYGLLYQANGESGRIEVPLAEYEAKKSSPNRQLLKDYAYWFWNNR
jgi:Calcium binding